MTKQTKRKGKTKMKNYQVNDVVQFMGDEYKVVEVLQMEDAVHIKKTSAPGNSMVVPVEKLENSEVAEKILEDLGHKLPKVKEVFDPLEGWYEVDVPDYDVAEENQPDLLYRPDDRISL